MKYFAVLPIVLVAFALGCVSSTTNNTYNSSIQPANESSSSMPSTALVAAVGDHVSVDYIGSFPNGTVFDTSIGRGPLEFDVGAGQMIKGFDAAVVGMRIGDEKNVTLAPQDAYGEPSPANIIPVPASDIPNGTKVGDTLYSGSQPVTIVSINSTTVVIDANHPLAGKTLVFWIRMDNITVPAK